MGTVPFSPPDASVPDAPGPLELLILQPTPFCNIDCSYCYMPDRQSTHRMTPATLDQVFRWVFASGLVREPFTLLWHAGEPLVLPVAFYEDATLRLDRHNNGSVDVLPSFQTNATLLTDEWCDYFLLHQAHVGVSVDGPHFLHDRHRRTRRGGATLDRVLAGIDLLHRRGVPFDVITVLTAESLDYPDELFDFYQANGIRRVAFNVEEVEGPHTTSSLEAAGTPERFCRFLARFLDLALNAEPPLEVREFETAAGALRHGCRFGAGSGTQENRPWAIVSVDWAGRFSTFSPELLGLASPRHGEFALGQVAADPLEQVLADPRYRRLEAEVAAGVERCRAECRYFPFCGGGAPGNKYFEHGTFDCTETLSCRLHKQASVDVTLDRLERSGV